MANGPTTIDLPPAATVGIERGRLVLRLPAPMGVWEIGGRLRLVCDSCDLSGAERDRFGNVTCPACGRFYRIGGHG